LWLHSLKVAQLLRSAACLHTNQSRSYLNHLVYYTAYIVKINFQATNIRKWWRIELLCHQSKTLFNISVTCQVHSCTHKAISVSKQKFYFKSKLNQFSFMFHYAVSYFDIYNKTDWRHSEHKRDTASSRYTQPKFLVRIYNI